MAYYKSMNRFIKAVKTRFKIISISLIIILSVFIYIERSHLGYFVYLYSRFTNSNTEYLENHLLDVLKNDPENLFVEFRSLNSEHIENLNVCHGIAHKLGHESYELYGFERSMQFAQAYCGAGFIHGIIEAEFGAFASLPDISHICDASNEKCNHGIGHGLMVYTKNDYKESLRQCDKLDLLAHSDCYDGVFMHIFDNEETGISKSIPERKEGKMLCAKVEAKYKKSCYYYVTRIFANDTNMDIESRDLCMSVPEDSVVVCTVGVGTMIGKYVFSDPQKALDMCKVFGDNTRYCEEGINIYRYKAF